MSRHVDTSTLGATGRQLRIEAKAEELDALATRLMVPAVISLTADLVVECDEEGVIALEGKFVSELTLTCAVTHEVFDARIAESIKRAFSMEAVSDEVAVDPLEDDIEPLSSPILDAGEIVVEELALAVPAFPRSEDADQFLEEHNPSADDGKRLPFAKLSKLVSIKS